MWKKAFALLQQMGKALMLPVSVLPVAGLLLGIGAAKFSKPEAFWWMPEWLATIMRNAGDAIFANLPLIFAIAVAIAFTANDGVSALAATVGFAVFLAALGAASTTLWGVDPEMLKPVMGIPTLDTGVFGGLVIGCIAAYLFNKFFRIQLPQYLGFFAGKRFVPIITGLVAIALGILFSVIWPPIGNAIDAAANAAAQGNNVPLTAAIYGIIERALLPFGLHHIWNVPFFFEIGSYTDPSTGQTVTGDINRFFAGDPTAGILGGAYWFKMFGLPAAAIAMWHSAYPKNRGRVSGLMLSAAFTSFLTGITEPIEFSFLFVAPQLYIAHAFMAGFCDWLFQMLGGKMGFTFSHGFIDFALFNTLGTNAWLIIAFGPLFAVLYYVVFRFVIKRFDLKTPGRELEEETSEAVLSGTGSTLAKQLVMAYGGRSNIAVLDACITRLRITVNDKSQVSKAKLKSLGASGVLEMGNSVQAIFGPRSENLKTDMIEYLQTAGDEADQVEAPDVAEASLTEQEEAASEVATASVDAAALSRVQDMVAALGGKANIRRVDPVALTRLRVEVEDSTRVNEEALQAAGVQGVLRLEGGVLHVLVGLGADQYAEEMSRRLAVV
ncbi:glucose-specific PTS transporter subunit IIBC [Leptolyngbya sp. AN02str]|uniref:glucose-specific PTS transporter subunit IIBC n=1 Tax=Leptolyngbya sp. AN02str TaxID=3423363 RepID=UPI003D322CEE